MNCNGSLSEAEYNVLWDLYNSTNGIHWTWSTQLPASTIWTFPSNLSTPCSNHWQGLVCSRESLNACSLEEILLNSCSLSGYLPSSLGNVVSLKNLKLSENRLTGTVPSELGNLQSLVWLYLDINRLSGTIPSELGNLQSLVFFDFGTNRISGTIPSELGSFESLENLGLSINRLSGTIPSKLGNLQSLEYLGLSINCLSGTIPSKLGNLQSLEYLGLSINCLSGTIPNELGNLQSLVYLDLDTNRLSGTIPSELENLQSLEGLYLNINRLSGTIPSELGNLQSLEYLYFYDNKLSGTIPSELGNLQSLEILDLNTNSVFGTIPSELGNLQSLEDLYLHTNSLSGAIPSGLGNLQSLEDLYLHTNSLSGAIPSELGNLQSTKIFLLDSNRLTGMIPTELKYLISLKALWLDSNEFTGELNGLFDNLLLLSSLDLSENKFSGSILDELMRLKKLSYLSVDYNLFTGTIPLELNLTSIQLLDLSGNFISGEIVGLPHLSQLTDIFAAQNLLSGSMPEFVFSLVLENLDLSDNLLSGSIGLQFSNSSDLKNIAFGGNDITGSIPDYFNDLPFLVSLNLSNNELTGELSGFSFSNCSLQSLDVSSNRLTGTLPSQLFQLSSLQDTLLNDNCFSGSLPETMCSNSALEYLVMNDLTSNCGSGIPKSLIPIFRGAVSQRLMSGSIPNCVWTMSGLRLLQLSGNGLTGFIGKSDVVSGNRSLRALLLSGNQLTGTIPEWIQTSSMLEQLDLSQNRLAGTLMSSLVISSASSLFRVSVNRLSGNLPEALFSTSSNLTLDVLDGNQFSCSSAGGLSGWGSILSPSCLPQSDVNRDTYVCGSSLFDNYLLFSVGCLFMFIFVVAILRLLLKEQFGMAAFRELSFNWNGLTSQLILSFLLLILFASFHIPTSSSAPFSTHSNQYLWMTTAAFLRGWAPVLIIIFVVGTGEIVIAETYGREKSSNAMIFQSDVLYSQVQCCRKILPYTCVHALNTVAVLATNAAYVYATVNGLPFNQLFVIQLSLGCFKLGWNGVAIPWLLRVLSKENKLTVHRIFMSLFAFIGGPLISTFFTASDCFLYVVIPQSPVTSVIVVPQYSCSSNCFSVCYFDTCVFDCRSICQFQPVNVATTSVPSWIYSYQCSSALLLNYIPVMIACTAISGLLLPCFVLSQFSLTGVVIVSWMEGIQVAPRSMLLGDAFDVVQLHRFLRLKTLVNWTMMLTFGFASPLLGVLVVLDSLIWSWMRQVLVLRQLDHLKSSSASTSVEQLEFSLKQSTSLESSHSLIVVCYVGVFWGLFVFDMIGDVYGDLSGGLSALTSMILGVLIWLLMRYRKYLNVNQSTSRSVTSPGLELCDQFTENALPRPEEHPES